MLCLQAKNYPSVWRDLARYNACVVHLIRQNVLDIFISDTVRKAVGKAHCNATDVHTCRARITLPVASLLPSLTKLEDLQAQWSHFLLTSQITFHTVFYESLHNANTSAARKTFSQLLRFLNPQSVPGVDASNPFPHSVYVKIGASQRDTLRNFDEVQAALAGTRFESYVH